MKQHDTRCGAHFEKGDSRLDETTRQEKRNGAEGKGGVVYYLTGFQVRALYDESLKYSAI